MATYSGDRKIQLLAVYKTLLDATPESPATVSKIIQNVKKDFNISVSRATVGADISCIEIVDSRLRVRRKGKKGYGYQYWIERGESDVGT